ncbi:MAG: hypothetical protein HKM06_07320 [Spirochaetales bacterium]|nr:hypothetical protein [Spirochaetales bacterium]
MTSSESDWFSKTSSVQTMKAWARRPESPSELPAMFQKAFLDEPFPLDPVFLPGETSGSERFVAIPARLAGFYADHLAVWEESGGALQKTVVPFSKIRWTQRGVMLLSSWLDVVSEVSSVRLSFASVNEELMDPFLARLREASAPSGQQEKSVWESGRQALDRIGDLHFKFMSYGRRLLRPGDRVLEVAYQQSRKLGWRKIATPFLVVLTDKELLLIRDPERLRRGRHGSYGAVFTFVPRTQITAITWGERPRRHAGSLEIFVAGGPPLILDADLNNGEMAALAGRF